MTFEGGSGNWDLSKRNAMLQAVGHARLPLCVTDPTLVDNPIVYANRAFTSLTGYETDEIIGRNCRFLQGPDTTQESIAAVRKMIETQTVDTVEIVNYRKDGTKFLNALQIGPILDDQGKLVLFFGSQLDITARRQAEDAAKNLANAELVHRLKNVTNVMAVMIRMTMNEGTDPATMRAKLTQRLFALGEAHINSILQSDDAVPKFDDQARSILAAYAPLGQAQFQLSGPDLLLPVSAISLVAMVLHELATNAVKHGALGCESGVVQVS